jgi:hypothetical protein
MPLHADIALHQEWCRIFRRLLLSRRKKPDSNRFVFEDSVYTIEPILDTGGAWKVRTNKVGTALVDAPFPGRYVIADIKNTHNILAQMPNILERSFFHEMLQQTPNHQQLVVSLTADKTASSTQKWCLEMKRVRDAKSYWWVFCDTKKDWLIRTTKSVREAVPVFKKKYGRKGGDQKWTIIPVPKQELAEFGIDHNAQRLRDEKLFLEHYAKDLRKEHPDWDEAQIIAEARLMVEQAFSDMK